jgi:membrane associated rhomboid family serine protease
MLRIRNKYTFELLVVSWNGVVQKNRVWTLLTSAFSHFDFTHFLINSFVLYSFGKTLF